MAEENKNDQQTPQGEKTPTVEELLARVKALEDEKKVMQGTIDKQKASIDNASGDAAEWKRKYRSTLDDATRKEQEQTERLSQIEAELAGYKTRDVKNGYAQKLVDAGYDMATAKAMADGLPEGVPDTFFESQKTFLANKTQELKTAAINSQPNLPAGATPSSQDAQSAEDAKLRKWFGLA